MLALGNYGVGWLGTFYELLGPQRFWLMNAAVPFLSVTIYALAGPWLRRRLTAD